MYASKTALAVAVVSLLASSGVAHRQLLQDSPAPGPACMTIAQTAEENGLTTLLAAAEAAGLSGLLSDPSTAYTVFAPTNDAFTNAEPALNVTSDDELLASPLLPTILENHLLGYPLPINDLVAYGNVTTGADDMTLTISSIYDGEETVTEVSTPESTANVTQGDIQACASIIHVIDGVLIPEL